MLQPCKYRATFQKRWHLLPCLNVFDNRFVLVRVILRTAAEQSLLSVCEEIDCGMIHWKWLLMKALVDNMRARRLFSCLGTPLERGKLTPICCVKLEAFCACITAGDLFHAQSRPGGWDEGYGDNFVPGITHSSTNSPLFSSSQFISKRTCPSQSILFCK